MQKLNEEQKTKIRKEYQEEFGHFPNESTCKFLYNIIEEGFKYEEEQQPDKEEIEHTKFTKEQMLDIEHIAFECYKTESQKHVEEFHNV